MFSLCNYRLSHSLYSWVFSSFSLFLITGDRFLMLNTLFSDFTLLFSLCFLTWLLATCPMSLSPFAGQGPVSMFVEGPAHLLNLVPVAVISTCPWTNLIVKTTLWGGTFLVVQWIGLGTFTVQALDPVLAWGTKILQAMQYGQKKKKEKQLCEVSKISVL